MVDKFMQISNDATQNYPFCKLQLVVKTFENSSNKQLTMGPLYVY